MQSNNFINMFLNTAFGFCLLMGLPTVGFAEYINIDKILFEENSSSDPPWQDLEPRVEMSFDATSKMLTVVLSNEACYTGTPDAGHLLTGLGFTLLPGVSIEDTAGRNSAIRLPAGSVIIDPVTDPNGTSGILLSQNDWGYVNGGAMGHFLDPGESTVNTVLSTMKSDSAMTFAGNAASNALMDSFDYGIQGLAPTPGHSNKRSIRNALAFDLYLDGPAATDWNGLLANIKACPVVVSYGSPGSFIAVPEPATSSMCLVMFGVVLIFRLRCCRTEI